MSSVISTASSSDSNLPIMSSLTNTFTWKKEWQDFEQDEKCESDVFGSSLFVNFRLHFENYYIHEDCCDCCTMRDTLEEFDFEFDDIYINRLYLSLLPVCENDWSRVEVRFKHAFSNSKNNKQVLGKLKVTFTIFDFHSLHFRKEKV